MAHCSGADFPAKAIGVWRHVRIVDAHTVEFIFMTAKTADRAPYNPDHFRCTVQSANALDCYNQDSGGSISGMIILSRVGA